MKMDFPYRLLIADYLQKKLEEVKKNKSPIVSGARSNIEIGINTIAYCLVVKNLEELSKQFLDYENYDIIIQKKSKVT